MLLINKKKMFFKSNSNKKTNKEGLVKIYYRGLDIIGNDDIPEGPPVHPILKDWDNNYYELSKSVGSKKVKAKVLRGQLENMSKTSQYHLKQNPKSDQIIKVNKKKFLKAVEKFIKGHRKKDYLLLDFSKNCIGFMNYILDKSQIK